MSKFQCFIDTSDITECLLVVLPSPEAIETESFEFYDDYYIQLMLSSVQGNLYFFIFLFIHSQKEHKKDSELKEPEKKPIGTVHFKVFSIFKYSKSLDLNKWIKYQMFYAKNLQLLLLKNSIHIAQIIKLENIIFPAPMYLFMTDTLYFHVF